MPRKKVELTEKRRENVKKVIKTIMEENDIHSQKELAELIFCSSEQITRMKNGERGMSDSTADSIIRAFPDKNYPKNWLLGIEDHRTPTDAFRAWTEDEFQSARDRHTITNAVAEMMRLCGVDWDGNTSVQYAPGSDGLLHPVETDPVKVGDADFYPWELSVIADKVFEYMKMELHFAVIAKEREAAQKKPHRSSVVHIKTD